MLRTSLGDLNDCVKQGGGQTAVTGESRMTRYECRIYYPNYVFVSRCCFIFHTGNIFTTEYECADSKFVFVDSKLVTRCSGTLTGDVVGPNNSGEVCIKSPHLMLRYHNNWCLRRNFHLPHISLSFTLILFMTICILFDFWSTWSNKLLFRCCSKCSIILLLYYNIAIHIYRNKMNVLGLATKCC